MLDETKLATDDELDILVLSLRAIDVFMPLYTAQQRDVMLPYVRSLAVYEASRPAVRRPVSNVVDFDAALTRSRLEKAINRERRSALADGQQLLQHGVNEFGDAINACDDID